MKDEVLKSKEAIVDEIAQKFTDAQSSVIVEYHGLSVADIIDLRRQLKAENIEFKVYKNTMTKRAVEKAGLKELDDQMEGPNAIAFSDDAVAPSRILATYAKSKPQMKIKAGVIEGKVVDADKIREISVLPGREGMISMLLSCFQSSIRNFAYAVNSIAEQKSE